MKKAAIHKRAWEKRYAEGRKLNKYPYDAVVSLVMRRFARSDHGQVRVLDYGCGGGNHLGFLAAEGFDVYAIDQAPTAVAASLGVLESFAYDHLDQRVQCADFARLPFAAGGFDAVIDRQSLGQNPAGALPAMVAEIHRVLAPGGVYFGINFSDQHPQLRFGKNAGAGDFEDFSQGTFAELERRHFFSVSEVYDLFSAFDIEDIRVSRNCSLLREADGNEELIVIASRPRSARTDAE